MLDKRLLYDVRATAPKILKSHNNNLFSIIFSSGDVLKRKSYGLDIRARIRVELPLNNFWIQKLIVSNKFQIISSCINSLKSKLNENSKSN